MTVPPNEPPPNRFVEVPVVPVVFEVLEPKMLPPPPDVPVFPKILMVGCC